jgi:hypothetical protein
VESPGTDKNWEMIINPIKLDLSVHCIETEVKRVYNKLLSKVFKEKEGREGREGIENQIEILKHSLENLDFPKLRTTYPELAGGSSSQVLIFGDKKGPLVIQINGKAIPTVFIRRKHFGKF